MIYINTNFYRSHAAKHLTVIKKNFTLKTSFFNPTFQEILPFRKEFHKFWGNLRNKKREKYYYKRITLYTIDKQEEIGTISFSKRTNLAFDFSQGVATAY